MPQFFGRKNDEIAQGNRHYWNITTLLPANVNSANRKFELHNKSWNVWAFFLDGELDVNISGCSLKDDDDLNRSIDMRIGIVRGDLKEVAAVKAEFRKYIGSMFVADNLIRRSQVNPTMYLFVEIRRKDSIHKIKALPEELLHSGENSDVIIQVQHRRFNCHKWILEARSPVFSAMMKDDMREKASGMVTIKDAESTTFEQFLLYLYSGNKDYLSWEKVTDLYKLANKYAVEDMKKLCVEHIKKNITVENFCELNQLSQLHIDSELTNIIVQFFLKNSKEIVRSKNWIAYLSSNPVESNVLITALVDNSF